MASPSRRRSPDDAPVAPLDVDLGRVMTIGTGLWLVALAVTLVLWLTDAVGGIPVAVSATGAVLGVVGWDWARRHRPTTDS